MITRFKAKPYISAAQVYILQARMGLAVFCTYYWQQSYDRNPRTSILLC